MTFLFANVIPNCHVSSLTIPQAQLIFCIMQSYLLDEADMITEEIFNIVTP